MNTGSELARTPGMGTPGGTNRVVGVILAFVAAMLSPVVPADARQEGPAGRDNDPDTTFMSGAVTVMAWKSPSILLIRVPDTLTFLYLPRNTATVDSVARRENLRCAINGSFFNGTRGNATHAGVLTLFGRPVAPAIDDRELTHVVRLNSRTRSVEFLPVRSYLPASDPNGVEFQTGPLIIDNGTIRDDLIRSSVNGLTAHTRTLIATLDRRTCFFVTVAERVTLRDLATFLVRLRVFQGERLDVVNLDGGSSVALSLRDAPGWNYNARDRLPILIGFH